MRGIAILKCGHLISTKVLKPKVLFWLNDSCYICCYGAINLEKPAASEYILASQWEEEQE